MNRALRIIVSLSAVLLSGIHTVSFADSKPNPAHIGKSTHYVYSANQNYSDYRSTG